MTECQYKNRCPYLDYNSPEEILSENKRLEKWLSDKDTLIILATEEIKKRDEKIKELESQIQNFKDALKNVRQKPFKPSKGKKENVEGLDEEEKQEPSQRGAPRGHHGGTRSKPEHIDEYKDVYAEKCERCNSKNIKHSNENYDEHTVEDIEIVVITKAICYRHHKYYCYDCKYTGISESAEDEIPNSFIGPVAKSVAAYLRYQIGTTYGQVEKIMADLFGLKLTRSALVGFDEAIYQKGKPFYEILKKKLYLSRYCGIDETSWLVLVTGQEWMWIFNSEDICLYLINKSRGSDVVKLVLGEDYFGIIVSDCFSAYNPVSAGAKQKCVTHILRKNKELEEFSDSNIEVFTTLVKDLFQGALKLKEEYKAGNVTEEELSKKATDFKDELLKITRNELKNDEAEKLRKRLIKHKDELFTFLIYPYVPADNNSSERGLKPCIIHRKLMYFNTSEQGARHYEVIMSLTQTAKRNGHNSLELIKKLLTKNTTEEIIKLLLKENSNDDIPMEQEIAADEYIISSEVSPEPKYALVGSGYS